MASHLFESETANPDFKGFHFKICGWPADKNAMSFDSFIGEIAGHLQLVTADFSKNQNDVAFVSKYGLYGGGANTEEANIDEDQAQTRNRRET